MKKGIPVFLMGNGYLGLKHTDFNPKPSILTKHVRLTRTDTRYKEWKAAIQKNKHLAKHSKSIN